ncbi:60Kd inner membrane protein-domain-containing protein [Pelagophyceae sp. CCMP2097]|nr:60Kd inner membrane protein-domain-containing protein [Pelagophyceae sp. CCMP2097]
MLRRGERLARCAWRAPAQQRPFGAVAAVVEGLTAAHGAGVPWYAVIVGTSVAVRLTLLPVTLLARRAAKRLAAAGPEMSKLNTLVVDALKQRKDNEERTRIAALWASGIHSTLKKHPGSNPMVALFLAPAVHIPTFITLALAVRQLVGAEGFDTGGLLWFTDLGPPDTALAVMAVAGGYANLQLTATDKRDAFAYIRNAAQLGLICALPLTGHLPAGFLLYWISSSAFSAAQIFAFRRLDGAAQPQPAKPQLTETPQGPLEELVQPTEVKVFKSRDTAEGRKGTR